MAARAAWTCTEVILARGRTGGGRACRTLAQRRAGRCGACRTLAQRRSGRCGACPACTSPCRASPAPTRPLALRCGLPRWYMRGRPALRMTDAVRDMAGWCGWIRARGGAAVRTGALVSAWRGRAFGRPRGSAAGSLLPSMARLQWLADTPALELRCGLHRQCLQHRPALRVGRRQKSCPGGAVGSGRAAARQSLPAPLFRLGAAGRSAGRAAVPRVCCCLPWRDFNGLRILRPGPPWPGVRDRARQWRASAVAHPLGWWVRCSFCRCSRATRV